ncbi:4-hydroxythreonine-4-phosphate dehydrogenase PdxA [Fulvimarina sp. 2208YS6-2-32]|uniref:4-hydroxythreonine-4-phosphate dehydrogenase n=1 Tax=Fulvimarina uroteuthidis TaxID=3098149 RepID=A0ABU5I6C2_9HYPH|nr:4-hydroxythreonine-4-phosphate dehydrogenase PdxA [Fulvimarina sp. 2208YS6-2-32]MDY8110463.1 4-hydroxythreonine-4-phosphate dehydrogenase PdxA [Fulvimarina sp. 2208YS6-2-32]
MRTGPSTSGDGNRASVLAFTLGEPSGVGPDLVLDLHRSGVLASIPYFVIADPEMMASRAKRLRLTIPMVRIDTPAAYASVPHGALPVLPLVNRHLDEPGHVDPANGAGTIEAIDRATALALRSEIGGIVTGPIDKKALYDVGFRHPGHTEYLADLCSQATGRPITPVMLLAGPDLSCVPVTIHVPLASVSRLLTCDLIVETCRIVNRDLKAKFAIPHPRLALAGLNPHAGERGSIGLEDETVVRPAVEILRRDGIDATGPLPADTMFNARARRAYDVAICMYHDQALIPAKTLAFDETVNITLGLPIIRTSPDHGTAADIAGRGVARPDSFRAAVEKAWMMAQSSATAGPLDRSETVSH